MIHKTLVVRSAGAPKAGEIGALGLTGFDRTPDRTDGQL
jgi:hypothetical protein